MGKERSSMDWAKVLVIVLSVILAIIIDMLYNNRGLEDLKSENNVSVFNGVTTTLYKNQAVMRKI